MKDSLERSHSKLSNFKLTMILFLGVIFFTALWLGIIILKEYETLGLILIGVGLLFSIVSLLLIKKFVR